MPVCFETLYDEYEHTTNVCKFCEDYKASDTATRFLLIRSLDKADLKYIIETFSSKNTDGDIQTLFHKAYDSSVTIPQLLEYIESQRPAIIERRTAELEGPSNVLAEIPIVHCGVHNDKVDNIVTAFVRNKSLGTAKAFLAELNTAVLPRIKQYILWSYYNQTANDIIELFFLKHQAVIPTLRKIRHIDFFLRVEDSIIPFDLKFTHISDTYFNLASQGIIKNTSRSDTAFDDFYISKNTGTNELTRIKKYYSAFKRAHMNVSY